MYRDDVQTLKSTLDRLLEERPPRRDRDQDPVELVWQYDAPEDREIAALVTASLAYGRAELARDAARRALEPLGDAPADFLRRHDPADALAAPLDDFVYRMTRGPDLLDLYSGIATLLDRHGSLEGAYDASEAGSHVERASDFVQCLRAGRLRDDVERGLSYLTSDPADGSACKRLHMFFRWVGRGPDGVDLGLWNALDASELLMPMDTHTSRICRYIGLTDRKTVDHKMAVEVTDSLRELDPDDPVKYDFALCHLGISDDCIHERSEEHCPSCPLEAICTL